TVSLISQRELKDGAAIQIYLDVEGHSFERAASIRKFYDVSRSEEMTKFTFPEVNPEVMGSLSDLLDKKITMEEMKKHVLTTLEEISDSVITQDFSEHQL